LFLVWYAKAHQQRACDAIAQAFGRRAPGQRIKTYAAGGYYTSEAGTDGLRDELAGYLAAGFTEVKMKIGAVPLIEDLKRVERALTVVPQSWRLAVDANGRYSLPQARAACDVFEPFKLMWLEEMGDPLDFALHTDLSTEFDATFATGENLFSVQDVTNLLRYASLRSKRDVLQMDPGLSYGITGFAQMPKAAESLGWSGQCWWPHGGNLISLQTAAAFGLAGTEAYP
jgi:D(-)-tartrate dehydratase